MLHSLNWAHNIAQQKYGFLTSRLEVEKLNMAKFLKENELILDKNTIKNLDNRVSQEIAGIFLKIIGYNYLQDWDSFMVHYKYVIGYN